ncbi:geranylgeranyl reductase [Methanococcus aeolicus Nankai-3]|uniref:Geranylgeranyl reductase n=1 Tax=Methanococcus aeolicus (strain ATCC BAA-1280 / DSM 17508 / OCM 812 / Nankai-3) TaxID=419665 RepID=A6UWQ3_META3|nr:geranylgeranyl reductase family protein [Methanococcus aeolicus]ABR56925.1 geranylgeranyl reductase [Methanococcus aeolicus Nankai-3]
MDIDNYDVIIVGGGPAGCITGENIKNHKVLIIEEHQCIGTPLQCAGLISTNGVKELGAPRGCVNDIKGAYIYSQNKVIKVGNNKIRAKVYERKVMDKDIAIRASKNKNVDILLKAHGQIIEDKNKNKSRFFNKNNNYGLSINHDGNKYNAFPKIIVGADGAKSFIGKSANIVKKREILAGAQLEMANVDIDTDFVHVFIDNRYCKDFFIWIIPMGKDRVRVGLCDSSNSYNKLLNFINNHPIASNLLKNAVPIEFSVGTLPIGYNKSSVKNNLMLVGDSAGQIKPISGGGLYYGAKSAKICGEIITNYLSEELPVNYLKNYDKQWKQQFKREIDFGIKFRKILYNMNNNSLDKILEFIIQNDLINFINDNGDMDRPSTILNEIISSKIGFKI